MSNPWTHTTTPPGVISGTAVAEDPWKTAARKGAERMTVEDFEAQTKDLLARYTGPAPHDLGVGDLVLIEWDDATQPTGWVAPGDMDPELALCTSVGWITHRDERVIILAATKCDDEVMGAIRIPAKTVRKIVPL